MADKASMKKSIYGSWDEDTVNTFKKWQRRTILITMIGYAAFYLVRKNFSLAMPGMTAEYGISNTSFGIVIGIGSLIYGLSRFLNGFLADRVSARLLMSTGLLLCALANIAFGFGYDLSYLVTDADDGPQVVNTLIMIMGITIIVNQYFQGMGFPPCARTLPQWIHPSELATKMSIWNTSHSIGAACAVVVCGYIMAHFGIDMSHDPDVVAGIATNLGISQDDPEGMKRVMEYASHTGAWKWCFWIPAIVSLVTSVWLFFGLKDSPSKVGLPELPGTETTHGNDSEAKANRRFMMYMVFRNPYIWILCIANLFVYVMRMGILDWGPKFLTESRGMSIVNAGWSVALFEICAVAGMLVAGWMTDRFFKGKAHHTCVYCMVGATIFMGIFVLFPDLPAVVSSACLALSGFCIYGPQALVGVAIANQATKDLSATANGLNGILGYLGSFFSALGVGILADHFGWDTVFMAIICAGVVGGVIFSLMWKAPRDGYGRARKFE